MSLRILITNDDGVDAPGIAIMADIANALSDDVWIVAPDGNQSGAGHRFTLGRELHFEQHAERTFAVVGGSPADCVVTGMTHLLGDRPAAVPEQLMMSPRFWPALTPESTRSAGLSPRMWVMPATTQSAGEPPLTA